MNPEETAKRAAGPASLETLQALAAEVAAAEIATIRQPKAPSRKKSSTYYRKADARRRRERHERELRAVAEAAKGRLLALKGAGLSYRQIADDLNERGLRYVGGAAWTKDTVAKTLKRRLLDG